jgi:hypothetical protein
MNTYIIPAALVVTLIVTFIISVFSKRRIKSLWVIFILIFLATWTGQLWITPVGPSSGGVAWIPLAVTALIILFFILAIIPVVPKVNKEGEVEDGPLIAIGIFFWIMIVLLIFSIAVGYYRSNALIAV